MQKDLETYEKPALLTPKTVIKWSEHYKRLEMEGEKTYSIRAKARKFIENNCIEYDKEKKCYLCKPIKGYNSTTYHLINKNGEFECSCQFHQKTKRMCSHILALYLQLKIWNWNKRAEKNINSFEFI